MLCAPYAEAAQQKTKTLTTEALAAGTWQVARRSVVLTGALADNYA